MSPAVLTWHNFLLPSCFYAPTHSHHILAEPGGIFWRHKPENTFPSAWQLMALSSSKFYITWTKLDPHLLVLLLLITRSKRCWASSSALTHLRMSTHAYPWARTTCHAHFSQDEIFLISFSQKGLMKLTHPSLLYY